MAEDEGDDTASKWQPSPLQTQHAKSSRQSGTNFVIYKDSYFGKHPVLHCRRNANRAEVLINTKPHVYSQQRGAEKGRIWVIYMAPILLVCLPACMQGIRSFASCKAQKRVLSSVKSYVLLDITLYSPVKVNRHFGGICAPPSS